MIKKMAAVLLAFFAVFSYSGPVSCYGELKASGNKLVGSKTGTTPVQVRGVSFGWSNSTWESARFFNDIAVDAMVDDWKAEIIRAPLGIGSNGYLNNGTPTAQQANNKTRVINVIEAALKKDVYIIIDWHSHNAHTETQYAREFFTEMAQTYGHLDNVIFEIYNEPQTTAWNTIKSYAEQVIPAIRQYSDNLIIVGTRNWSQYVDEPASNKINDPNVAYVFHFYAYTHRLSDFQSRINTALNANIPIFVSEYGTTHSDGGTNNNYGTHNASSTEAWHNFMDQNKISSVAWNINDKAEGSAFFGLQSNRRFDLSGWTDKSQMSPSGQYIYDKLTGYYNAGLAWQNCTTPITAKQPAIISSEPAHYYTIKGEPLGIEKPKKAGVYIIRQDGKFSILPIK